MKYNIKFQNTLAAKMLRSHPWAVLTSPSLAGSSDRQELSLSLQQNFPSSPEVSASLLASKGCLCLTVPAPTWQTLSISTLWGITPAGFSRPHAGRQSHSSPAYSSSPSFYKKPEREGKALPALSKGHNFISQQPSPNQFRNRN